MKKIFIFLICSMFLFSSCGLKKIKYDFDENSIEVSDKAKKEIAFNPIGNYEDKIDPLAYAQDVGANSKVTELAELSAEADGIDLLYIIDDPGETPTSKKITRTNLLGAYLYGLASGTLSASKTVAVGGYSVTWTSTLDNGTVFKIDNTDADLTNDTTLLELEFTDDGDANGIFLECKDNNGNVVYKIGADGAVETGSSGTGSVSIGSAGVVITDDGDGSYTITGNGDGNDEALTYDLDNTEDEVTVTTSTGVTKINYGSTISLNHLVIDVDYVPVGYMVADGTTDPADASAEDLINFRKFDANSDEDLEFMWPAPADLTGSTIKIQVIAVITESTEPGSGEGISWGLSGCSSGDDDDIDCAVGTEVNSEDTDINSQSQWDYVITPYVEVTPTNLAAGENVHIRIDRDTSDSDDDYGQDIGLVGVNIKYKRLRNVTF